MQMLSGYGALETQKRVALSYVAIRVFAWRIILRRASFGHATKE